MEQHLFFESQGQRLLGVLHRPDGRMRSGGLVFLHGWAGYRIGPHQMFTKLARRAAAQGFCCLRFDFRGRGDSEGDAEAATLSTMIEDTLAAGAYFRDATGLRRLALIGDCSGSEVAIGAAPLMEGCDSLVLWSAPIVGADRTQAESAKRSAILKQYWRKLLRAETWRKLLAGRLQGGMIRKTILRGGRGAGEEGAASDADIDWLGRFDEFQGERLFIYGGNDPTRAACVEHYESLCNRARRPFERHIVEGSNHAFYALRWEDEVIRTSLEWLQQQYPT